MPRQPKSELTKQTDTFIGFGVDGNYLHVEKNVGQYSFEGAPYPKTDFVLLSIDGEEWFMSKGDGKLLAAWLTKVTA